MYLEPGPSLDLLLIGLGVGSLMALAGIQKGALVRKRPRICPSCDREVTRCRCRG